MLNELIKTLYTKPITEDPYCTLQGQMVFCASIRSSATSAVLFTGNLQ